MKNSYFFICVSFMFFCNLPLSSQNLSTRTNNPEPPLFITPKSHDPNFLKSGKISEKSFYQRKSEWKHIIDTTWGPGVPLAEKLLIYNTYAKAIREKSDVLCKLNMNWDSLYNHYLNQITESTSKGAFSSIMSHFSYDLKDLHTVAFDTTVVFSALNPGVPVLLLGSYNSVEHFGAVTTVLPDSTALVLRPVPNHPLNLVPGDIILGYEGIPWKNLVTELINAGLPMVEMTGGCKSTYTYNSLFGVGLNWHLFSTIDILKYSTGDTIHLSVLPLLDLNLPRMSNNEQLPIKNIPFTHALPFFAVTDTVVTYGILENTNIGYVFLAAEPLSGIADVQFYNAINALKNTDALIIDMRLNFGGRAFFDKAFNLLFNEFHKTVEHAYRCNTNSFELCPGGNSELFQINGKDPDYYDRPIAVLLGPSCMSNGDWNAQRLRYHPMVRFFGANPGTTHGWGFTMENIPDWLLGYSGGDMFHVSQPGIYLNRSEFPIDYPVWFNKDDVAKGIDPVVEKSLSWINNLAYGHSINIEKGNYSSNDTIRIDAFVRNPNSHELSVNLIFESLDGLVVDSIEMTQSNLPNGNNWLGKLKMNSLPENNYWVSVNVIDHTDRSSFNNKHMTRVTTRPLEIGTLSSTKGVDSNYTIKTELKNSGKTGTIYSSTIKLVSDNPWIKSITPELVTFSGAQPGAIRRIPNFTVKVDEASFPGYLDLTYTITEDDWPYWVLDTTLAIVPTSMEKIESLTNVYNLEQNYPNPFNSVTTIYWQLPQSRKVTLKVLDMVGRTVAIMVDEQRPCGKYSNLFNGTTLPKGIYFYQLKAGDFIQTRKMILLK